MPHSYKHFRRDSEGIAAGGCVYSSILWLAVLAVLLTIGMVAYDHYAAVGLQGEHGP